MAAYDWVFHSKTVLKLRENIEKLDNISKMCLFCGYQYSKVPNMWLFGNHNLVVWNKYLV